MEIERKFLVENVPDMNIIYSNIIFQNYLATGEEEIRVRCMYPDRYYMTIKKGSGLCREEQEFVISKETYEQLNKNFKEPIHKVRSVFRIGYDTFYLDEYLGELNGLKIVEVEFETVQQAQEFNVPQWCYQDVTYDKQFKNQKLWESINEVKNNG